MLKSDAAAYLAGVTQVEGAQASAPTNLHVIAGEVGQNSEDGKTTVSVDGLVFSEEDSQEIEMDTLGGLEEGDIATIILTGEAGHGMTPLAIGAVGSVDRINAKVIETQLLLADKADIQDLTAATARIDDLEADHVTVNDFTAATGRIGDLEADNVTINGRLQAAELDIDGIQADYLKAADLQAEQARVDNLLANKASVSDLNAAKGRISDLEADHVSVEDFEAEQANIDTLQANTADIDTIRANSAKVQNLTAAQLEADHATIGTLDTTYATIANLNAANGRIDTLESTKANISDLEADYITADVIEATYMHANMSNSDVAWIENGTIKNGAIVSAMINDVSANKLTAGTINGSVINVTNLNADNITTGTINGQRIGEGSLSLSKLDESVYTEAEVNSIVDGLNDRIDGAIETFTGTVVPTLNNSPASSWNTTKLRDEHVGDVYYVVNSQSQQNGYCYRFTKSGSTYSWQLIKDSDVTAALSRLTTAEGKITTFDSDISTLKTDTGTLTTRTTSLETRMSDAEDDILDKVDTTTFNEVSDTVDAHTQTISQHTTAISNKADNSTVTAVTNRVSKNEQDISGINTTIGQLQTTVASKADGSTVTTISNKLNTVSDTVDGHTQNITSLQNTVSQKADGSTVSTLQSDYATFKQQTTQFESTIGTRVTTVENEFDNLEIGGRNLLFLTRDFKAKSGSTTGGYLSAVSLETRIPIVSETYKGLAVRRFMTSGIDASTYYDLCYSSLLIPISGNSYVFSFYAKGSGKVRTHFYPNNSGGTYKNAGSQGQSNTATDGNTDFTVSSDWQRFWVRFEIGGTQGTNARHAILRTFGGNDIYVCGLKFEDGTKATGWSPAPEDIDSRVDEAESSITQNATNINAKVSKNDVINQINLSTEGVLIDADRVEINGTAVFNAIKPSTDAAYDAKDAASTALSDAKTYADTKKSEAISTAAADATSKANAAQTAATNAANTATDQKLTSYSTTQQMNEAIQGATGPLFYDKANSTGYIHLGHVPYAVSSASNYSHLHLTGRIGGWLSTTSGSVDVTFKSRTDNALYNTVDRRDETIDTSFVDVLVYTGTDGFTHYWIKVNSYWYAQLYAEFEQFVEDDHTLTTTEPDGTCVWKLSEHTAVAATKSNAVKRTQRIYYRWNSATAPAAPASWVTKGDDGSALWTKMHVAITSTHKYIYTCEQYEMADGTLGHTDVLLDNTITVIDGGNIITDSITANKLNASDINASKTLTVGAMTDAAAATILNSNMKVGGRNLLQDSKFATAFGAGWWELEGLSATLSDNKLVIDGSVAATGNKRIYQPTVRFSHVKDITYTFSCDIVATAACQVSFGRRYGTTNDYGVTFNVTTTSQRISGTYTANYAGAFCISGVSNSATVTISNPKLEIGNKPTDWTPAPEDVDADISEAAQTATNYITTIDANNGIKIANASPSSATTYLQLASNFLDFIRGGVSMLKAWVDGTTAKVRVGAESGFNTLTDNEGIKLRRGTTVLSQFATNLIELGKNSYNATISLLNNGIEIYATDIDPDHRVHFGKITSGDSYLQFAPWSTVEGDESAYSASAKFGVKHEFTSTRGFGVDDSVNIGGDGFVGLTTALVDSDDVPLAEAGMYAATNMGAGNSEIAIIGDKVFLYDGGGNTSTYYGPFPMSDVASAIPVTLYDNASASASAAATLSETAANFKRLTIFFKDTDGNYSSTEVWSPNGKHVALSLTWISGNSSGSQTMYQRVRWVVISGTTISTYRVSTSERYRTGQAQIGGTGGVTNSDYISITHVIGYR